MTDPVDPSYFTVEKVELPTEPRFLFIRVSLEMAQLQVRELRRLAKLTGPADTQQAVAILQSEAIAAPEKELIPTCWDHPNAGYWLLPSYHLLGSRIVYRYSLLRR